MGKELGKGATGEVYMVRDEETGQPYAMKVTNRYTAGWSDEAQGAKSIALEIAVMKKLQHQNIVNLVEVILLISLHFILLYVVLLCLILSCLPKFDHIVATLA